MKRARSAIESLRREISKKLNGGFDKEAAVSIIQKVLSLTQPFMEGPQIPVVEYEANGLNTIKLPSPHYQSGAIFRVTTEFDYSEPGVTQSSNEFFFFAFVPIEEKYYYILSLEDKSDEYRTHYEYRPKHAYFRNIKTFSDEMEFLIEDTFNVFYGEDNHFLPSPHRVELMTTGISTKKKVEEKDTVTVSPGSQLIPGLT